MPDGPLSQPPETGIEQSLVSRNFLSDIALERVRRLAAESGER
jgi:hypothetical protein